MTCLGSTKTTQPKRGKVSWICVDPDDRCRYMGSLVNGGDHQFEDGECIVCGHDGTEGGGE